VAQKLSLPYGLMGIKIRQLIFLLRVYLSTSLKLLTIHNKWQKKPLKSGLRIIFNHMERLSNKSKEELLQVKDDYIKKYIGDFDKPLGYKQELKKLDRLIEVKD